MPVSYSSKRIADKELFAEWDSIPIKLIQKLGVTLGEARKLQSEIIGQIIMPGQKKKYDKARKLSNPLFDDHPMMIVYCKGEKDIATVLAFCRQKELQFCVRSGGHCTAGFSSGPGVLIDVGSLRSIVIDDDKKTATVGCGVTFGYLNSVLDFHDLHVPGGECPDVCVGGYVQGGGYGFTSVTYGMNCDNVIAMKVLLADGSVVEATEEKNHDLWWAMRGGTGGNFGILLSVTYRLYDVTDCFGFALIWPLNNETDFENAADVMLTLQASYMVPGTYANKMNLQVSLCYQTQIVPPGAKTKPEGPNWNKADYDGKMKPYLMVRGLYLDVAREGLGAINQLQAVHHCYTQWTAVERYEQMNLKLLEYPLEMPVLPSAPIEEKASRYVEKMLSKDEWTDLLRHFTTAQPNTAYMYLEFYGGVIMNPTNPAQSSNAFIHRKAAYNAVMDVFWFKEEEKAAAVTFLAEWKQKMEPHWNGHVYQNYPSPETTDYRFSYWTTYWGNRANTLGKIKHKYDPDSAFAFAQMVPVESMPDNDPNQGSWEPSKILKTSLASQIDYTGGIKPKNAPPG